jgi:hypothetical protein
MRAEQFEVLETRPDGSPVLFLGPIWTGEPAQVGKFIARMQSLGRPVLSQVAPMSLADLLGLHDAHTDCATSSGSMIPTTFFVGNTAAVDQYNCRGGMARRNGPRNVSGPLSHSMPGLVSIKSKWRGRFHIRFSQLLVRRFGFGSYSRYRHADTGPHKSAAGYCLSSTRPRALNSFQHRGRISRTGSIRSAPLYSAQGQSEL